MELVVDELEESITGFVTTGIMYQPTVTYAAPNLTEFMFTLEALSKPFCRMTSVLLLALNKAEDKLSS